MHYRARPRRNNVFVDPLVPSAAWKSGQAMAAELADIKSILFQRGFFFRPFLGFGPF